MGQHHSALQRPTQTESTNHKRVMTRGSDRGTLGYRLGSVDEERWQTFLKRQILPKAPSGKGYHGPRLPRRGRTSSRADFALQSMQAYVLQRLRELQFVAPAPTRWQLKKQREAVNTGGDHAPPAPKRKTTRRGRKVKQSRRARREEEEDVIVDAAGNVVAADDPRVAGIQWNTDVAVAADANGAVRQVDPAAFPDTA